LDQHQETLKRLLEQPELTEEDQQWLLRYLESSEQSELKQLLQEYYDGYLKKGAAIESDISDRILKGIHDKLAVEPAAKKGSVVKMTLVRAAVAAVIVALAFTSFYFLSKKNEPIKTATVDQPAPSLQQVAEVAPGTDGAILTLPDGSTILLDSLNDGALKEDKGSKISKQGNQVIYKDLKGGNEMTYNTMSTPRGRQFQLVLADGTKVWLNAASSIRFPTVFSGADRKVEVTGELYFEVAKNPSKPFKVIANGTEIEVLGTHFNVDGYDEVIKTTLLEGSVKIRAGSKTGLLKPGQQSQASSGGGIKTSGSVDVEKVMAWKNGHFAFDNASLEAIMEQVSRWYDVDVVYQDKVPKRFFTADISRKLNLSVFLKVLDESKVRFKIEGKKLLVQP
jgi:transmembrane sensor